MKKILILDDVESLRKAIEKALVREGFSVVCGTNGSDGLLLAEESEPDLVLTDAMMPGMDGPALCRVLKRKKGTRHIPVIIMSGEMMEEADIVAGLEGGADDYILKPFPMKVLLARIKTVLRRFEGSAKTRETLKKFGIELDPATREVKVAGKSVLLARKEFDLLALLLGSAGRVLTSNYLLETVWGYDLADYNDPHTVETHISRIRGKLGKKASKHIVNIRGAGYKFIE